MTARSVSVIVCTHNRASALPQVVGQLYAQHYPQDSFEVIIVDNRSTDNTAEVVQKFIEEKNIRLRYVKENRPGVSFARNRGAKEARYPYLAYLDDDCVVAENWLSELLSGFDLDEQVAIVGGRVEMAYDDQKIPAWLGAVSKRWLAEFKFPGSEPRLLDNATYVIEGNMAISKEAWQSGGGFLGIDQFSSPHVASQEIVYLLEQIKNQGGKVAFVPGAVANHHKLLPSKKQMITRAYFHGVSTGILNYLLEGFSWVPVISRIIFNAGSTFFLLLFSFLFLFNKPVSMDFLLRAAK